MPEIKTVQVCDTTNPTETFHNSKNLNSKKKHFYQTNYLSTRKKKRMQGQKDPSLNIFVSLDIFDANYDCP